MPSVVVFAGEKVRVRLNADEVATRLAGAIGPQRFERDEGGAVWVNPAAVLYVAELVGDTALGQPAGTDIRAAFVRP